MGQGGLSAPELGRVSAPNSHGTSGLDLDFFLLALISILEQAMFGKQRWEAQQLCQYLQCSNKKKILVSRCFC